MSMISGIVKNLSSQDLIEQSSPQFLSTTTEPPTDAPVIELAPEGGALPSKTRLATTEDPQQSSISFIFDRPKAEF